MTGSEVESRTPFDPGVHPIESMDDWADAFGTATDTRGPMVFVGAEVKDGEACFFLQGVDVETMLKLGYAVFSIFGLLEDAYAIVRFIDEPDRESLRVDFTEIRPRDTGE